MTVVYHGFNGGEFRPPHKDEISPREMPYFYFVGRLEHKKNIVRMLQAFAEFKQKTGLTHKFLLAGKPAFGYNTIQAAYDALPQTIQADVELLGFVPQTDSIRYLRHAEALIFTTLFEGFGIPALEAFASGTPVITSNTTSMPEVVDDAALTVDPTSIEAIAQAMTQIATDKKLCHELIQKGSEQYKKFSWNKAAQETLTVLKKVGSP
jgi:glycosyltransferase involved in cell wall biosynthesis